MFVCMYVFIYIFINTHYDLLSGSLQSFAHNKLNMIDNKLITIGKKKHRSLETVS